MKNTRKFDGKMYSLYSLIGFPTKKVAREVAEEIRSCGYFARITQGGNGYYVWQRRMS